MIRIFNRHTVKNSGLSISSEARPIFYLPGLPFGQRGQQISCLLSASTRTDAVVLLLSFHYRREEVPGKIGTMRFFEAHRL
jgi:hypothetical protein